ncbi:hypothetical protein P2318_30665 [Myxococcaceae bacterium GXIMD 01537]
MNRNRFVVAALALGGLLGAAEVKSTLSDQQKRLEDFQAKSKAARKAQKLDSETPALYTKYPTPEVEMTRTVETTGGKEATLTASGTFVPGSLLYVPCPGVEVLSSEVTKNRAEARVRVRPDAMPQECELRVFTPVSEFSTPAAVLRITGNYLWDLKFSNGMTARWKTSPGQSGALLEGDSEWFKQGKPLGARKVTIAPALKGVHATVERTAEENSAATATMDQNPNFDAQAAKLNTLLDKMNNECSKLPDAKQPACSAKYTAQIDELQKKMYAELDAASQKASTMTAVCDALDLSVDNGRVTGKATQCGGDTAELTVTGTFKPTGAK